MNESELFQQYQETPFQDPGQTDLHGIHSQIPADLHQAAASIRLSVLQPHSTHNGQASE